MYDDHDYVLVEQSMLCLTNFKQTIANYKLTDSRGISGGECIST